MSAMNQEQFEQRYMAQPHVPTGQPYLIRLWVSYYILAEEYDQSVCSGQNDYGEAMPRTTEERRLVNANAKLLLKRLDMLAESASYTAKMQARNTVNQWPQYVCTRYAEQHGLIDLTAQPEPDEPERMIETL